MISVNLGESYRVFKLVGAEDPHLHLVCGRCGAVVGVDIYPAESFAATLMEKYGFQADLTRLNIPGLCENCRGKKTHSITVNTLNLPHWAEKSMSIKINTTLPLSKETPLRTERW